jgi:hypothetical protein
VPRSPALALHLDALRRRLADIGVPLFDTPRARDEPDCSALIGELLLSADPRLVASIPCVFTARPQTSVCLDRAAAAFGPDDRSRAGLLHHVARCLVVSREPDLARLFGRAPSLDAATIEPRDLPPPSDSFGRAGLAAAADREPRLVGDAVRLFDQWLRILQLEQRTREFARTR